MITHKNWTVQADIYPLFKFVLPMLEGVFGQAVMAAESCTVTIDMNCPTAPLMLFNPTRIILKAVPTAFCQVIRQMAHELTHYAVRQNTDYQYSTCAIAAFEEPACEAVAMYILKLCVEQWKACDYYPINLNYAQNFERYCSDIYNDVTGKRPMTYSEWTSICEGFTGRLTSESQRPNVSAIRNTLYDAFVEFPAAIGLFIKYPLFIRSFPFEKLIDEPKWKAAEPLNARFITAICSVQPTATDTLSSKEDSIDLTSPH